MPAPGLPLPARPSGTPRRSPSLHEPPSRRRPDRHALRRSLHHVHAVRAVYSRSFGNSRADGHQPWREGGDRHLPGPSARQQTLRQRRRPLPGGRSRRQGLPLPAACLVHEAGSQRLRWLLRRLFDPHRAQSRHRLPSQAARKPARQHVVDLRRRPLWLAPHPRHLAARGGLSPRRLEHAAGGRGVGRRCAASAGRPQGCRPAGRGRLADAHGRGGLDALRGRPVDRSAGVARRRPRAADGRRPDVPRRLHNPCGEVPEPPGCGRGRGAVRPDCSFMEPVCRACRQGAGRRGLGHRRVSRRLDR